MCTDIEVGVPSDATETQALAGVIGQSLGFPRGSWDAWLAVLGEQNLRRARQGGRVIAGLAQYNVGQWFGGQCVPMTGIAGVGVAPEARGQGVAARLVGDTLAEVRARGVPLAALYASSLHVYRKVGFETAGTYCRFGLSLGSLPAQGRELEVHAVDPALIAQFEPLHRARARASAGLLERDAMLWHRIVRKLEHPVYAYLIGDAAAPEGYVIFVQVGSPHYDLHVRDLVVTTPRAARRLWTLFSDHRSYARELEWSGPVSEPLLQLLPETIYSVRRLERWLLRVVDVAQALALRGYPEGSDEELHLEVRDELLAENQGRFVLRVRDGRAEVSRGGDGALRLDVRGLAPLYSGLHSAHQLAAIGQLEAPSAALQIADRLFRGPEPWMPEVF